MDHKICFQGVCVHRLNYNEFITIFKEYLRGNQKRCIAFINAHCVNIARRDKEYKELVSAFDLVLADGMGVLLASIACNDIIAENLNGTDLMPRLFRDIVPVGATFFLVGGKPGVAALAKQHLEKKWPGLRIVGHIHGYDIEGNRGVAAAINNAHPDIVLIGTGVPRQEKWIWQNKDKINAKIFMAIGGFIDFEAGVNKRAPRWMRRIGCEWIFRLFQEPRRMWRRYVFGNPEFLYYTIRDMMRGCRNGREAQ